MLYILHFKEIGLEIAINLEIKGLLGMNEPDFVPSSDYKIWLKF